jgi:hypothetical protein
VLRLASHGFNWDALDGTTVGPLNTVVLYWPALVGWVPSLATARLTGALLWAIVLVLTFDIGRRTLGRVLSLAALAPLLVFITRTGHPDFTHYGSELLPLTLLVSSAWAIMMWSERPCDSRGAWLLLAGLLAGAAPLAKLQSAPIGVAIGLWAVTHALRYKAQGGGWRPFALLGVGALVPLTLILSPLALRGGLSDFWRSYIVWSTVYVQAPLGLSELMWMLKSDYALLWAAEWWAVMLSAAIVASAAAALQVMPSFRLGIHRVEPSQFDGGSDAIARATDLAWSTVVLVAALWSVLKPGNGFPHYVNFLPPFAALLLILMLRAAPAEHLPRNAMLAAAAASGLALAMVAWRSGSLSDRAFYRPQPASAFWADAPDLLSWVPGPPSHLLVWGWMPHWYIWANLSPATRESHTYAQIVPSPLSEYFRSRFLSDFEHARPEVVIDAVAGQSFRFNAPDRQGPAIFEGFARRLTEEYAQVASATPLSRGCATTYLRLDTMRSFRQRRVVPRAVSASATYAQGASVFLPESVLDMSLTEDTCIDYWLLPDASAGTLRLDLTREELLAEVLLLNTHNGPYLDRAAVQVKVRLYREGREVDSREVEMRLHPSWTRMTYEPAVRADRVDVDVLTYRGVGGGLNEVILFRPASLL